MSAWAPPSVTHHRAWHARGSCRPHISLQRREHRSTVMAATFFCCPFSGLCLFQTPRGSSLCSITHITIMPGLPRLEYSRSSASDSHLYSQAQMLLEDTGLFISSLCSAHSDQGLSSCCVRCVTSIYCSRSSTGPPFWGYQMQQAVLETETTGISTFAVVLVPSSWCSIWSAHI